MGYGFSLFKNPSDHCNLAFGSVAIARIEGILNQRGPAAAVIDKPQTIGISNSKPSDDTSPGHSLLGVGWVRLIQGGQEDSKTSSNQHAYMFSPKFLEKASMAFSNARERTNGTFADGVDFSTTDVSRNKLHTMCAITMMLQKQQTDITIANAGLSAWPENERQFHAARYRRGQLLILRTVIQSIIMNLRRLVGLDLSWPRDKRVISLEHILKAGPREFLQDFRAALHAGLGTRNPEKIKRQNAVEAAFTVWLYGLWLWTSSAFSPWRNQNSGNLLSDSIARWMAFIHVTYGQGSGTHRLWAETAASEEDDSLAESYHSIVKAAAAKNPRSLYSYPEADTDRLLWCLRIIREESHMCPSLDGDVGDEGDELMLFLEDGVNQIEQVDPTHGTYEKELGTENPAAEGH
ncbi:MAG: hypothetical protein Q9216_004487 [Gyalolechia sp. 2 TL-2023]